jgi:non-ribosomal peptide synthetase-like protein
VPQALPLVGRARPRLVTLLQLLSLLTMLCAGSFVAWFGILVVLPWILGFVSVATLLLVSPLLAVLLTALTTPLLLGLAACAKILLIGRYRPLRTPVYSLLYFRHWLVQQFVRLVPWRLLQGTVLFNAGLRTLGARIGKRVHVHRGVDLLHGGWDLIQLGDDVTLSQDAALGVAEFANGELIFAPVQLAAGSTLETRAGMDGGSSLGAGAQLAPLSWLDAGVDVPPGERWDGVPATRAGLAEQLPCRTELADFSPAHDTREHDSRPLSPGLHALHVIGARIVLASILSLPALLLILVPLLLVTLSNESILAWLFDASSRPLVFAAALLWSSLALLLGIFGSALLLRITRSVAPGLYSRWSTQYTRVLWRSELLQAAGNWLAGSLYWRIWLRLAGMRLGRNCEISTILDCLPERVQIDAETFFADGVYLGGPRLHRGRVQVDDTRLGPNCFVGNHAVIPSGTQLEGDLLLGVSTRADAEFMRPGTSWFGHPPFELPQREVIEMDRSLTHEPGLWLYAQRLFWESLRFGLPAVLGAGALLWIEWVAAQGVLFAPIASLALGLGILALVLATKWLLLGRVRAGQHGLWSSWCSRWDFVYMAWGMLSRGLLARFDGTLLLAWYLRAMGMRIGKHVVLAGSFAQVVDPDMLRVEDGATLDPLFQAHTFEDRVLKIAPLHVGRHSTVRRGSVLFYGAELEANCHVGPHSVVMKNELLRAGQRYHGCPSRPI